MDDLIICLIKQAVFDWQQAMIKGDAEVVKECEQFFLEDMEDYVSFSGSDFLERIKSNFDKGIIIKRARDEREGKVYVR